RDLGVMLFMFCVGVDTGPSLFAIFFREEKHYVILVLVMVGSEVWNAGGVDEQCW
ncbi:hypothetical protein, partial [Escherichia coli]|uniref:aspartate-alanine antiporter-like transporter n=1 Tax=Escherichia coli TaxID=562 RepID=UPI001BB28457